MTDPNINPVLFFDNVPDALAPLSAGSPTYICNTYLCNGQILQASVEPPHPTWTNLAGKAVVQMGAVELGGINGLNN